MPGSERSAKSRVWICLLPALVYCGSLACWVRTLPLSPGAYLVWAGIGVGLTCFTGRSGVYVFEASIAVVVWLLLGGPHYSHPAISCLPFAAMVLSVGAFDSS